jgi:hypothetical protein
MRLARQKTVTSKQIENGDIFYFFKPKIEAPEVIGIQDVKRF